jgi:predicted metalloprotease
MGRRSKSRSLISTHNLLIILCLILIAVSVHMLFSEDDEEMIVGQAKEQTQNQEKEQTENQTKTTENDEVTKKEDVKVVQSGNSANEITQQEARKLAAKQFKELDEKWVREKELEVLEFSRANEYYYYISSKENTIEIKKDGGKITRINSVPVQ